MPSFQSYDIFTVMQHCSMAYVISFLKMRWASWFWMENWKVNISGNRKTSRKYEHGGELVYLTS